MANSNTLSPQIKKIITQSLINKCHHILIEGYKLVNVAKIPLLNEMDEDNITANLIEYMNKVKETRSSAITITPQYPIYNSSILSGLQKAKTAPVIDIRMSRWSRTNNFNYFIEAKNLSEKDWIKSSGANVNSNYYKRRYINSGVDHFVNLHYPFGCLIGYIVNGRLAIIVKDINNILKLNMRHKERLTKNKKIYKRSCLYYSNHTSFNLLHFFFYI